MSMCSLQAFVPPLGVPLQEKIPSDHYLVHQQGMYSQNLRCVNSGRRIAVILGLEAKLWTAFLRS